MYAANLYKACVRVSENKFLGLKCCAVRCFANRASVSYSKPENGKSYLWCSMPHQSCRRLKLAVVGKTTQYSTHSSSPESAQEVVCKADESTEEDQDATTVGPPEELMQSLGEEAQRQLKIIWMEMEVARQKEFPVPRSMTYLEWKEVLEKKGHFQRLKFYKYLCLKESRKKNEKLKKEARRLELETFRETRQRDENDYGLCKNTIFLRIYKTSMNNVYNSRQSDAIQFGQSIVIDLGLAEHMVKMEYSNCAEQIKDMYGFNKMNRQPYHLHLCNAGPDNKVVQWLERYVPNLYSSMITITEKSYLDVFPKEKLVYLTPHCKNDLVKYDHDAVYIIGGIVDKTVQQPISLAKAKREGIAMARLPLDQYIDWGEGTKSLTLDQMMKIMLDIKNTGSWSTAFRHIPKRKLKLEDAKPRFRKTRNFFERYR